PSPCSICWVWKMKAESPWAAFLPKHRQRTPSPTHQSCKPQLGDRVDRWHRVPDYPAGGKSSFCFRCQTRRQTNADCRPSSRNTVSTAQCGKGPDSRHVGPFFHRLDSAKPQSWIPLAGILEVSGAAIAHGGSEISYRDCL